MLKSTAHRGNADLDPPTRFPRVTMLLERGVRLLLELRLELGFQWGSFGRGTSWNRLGTHMTLFTSLSDISLDRGFRHFQEASRFSLRFPFIYRLENTLPQVLRIRFHFADLLRKALALLFQFTLILRVLSSFFYRRLI